MKAVYIQVLKQMADSNRLGAKEQFDVAKLLENKRQPVAEQCLSNARRYMLQAEAIEALLAECSVSAEAEPFPRNGLNPGIAATVAWLQSKGFHTTDSGDGKTHDFECDLPIPYVHMTVHPSKAGAEAKRLKDELKRIGVKVEPCNEEGDVPHIEVHWNPVEAFAVISLYNVTLGETGKKGGA